MTYWCNRQEYFSDYPVGNFDGLSVGYSACQHWDNPQTAGFGSDVPRIVAASSDASFSGLFGTNYLQLNYEGQGEGNNAYGKTQLDFPIPTTWEEIFIRWWMRLDVNWTNPSAAGSSLHLSRYCYGSAPNQFSFTTYYRECQVDGTGNLSPTSPFGTNPIFEDPNPFLVRSQWHRMEYYLKHSVTTRAMMRTNGDIASHGTGTADVSGFGWSGVKPDLYTFCSNWSSALYPPDGTNYLGIAGWEIYTDAQWGANLPTTGSMTAGDIAVAASVTKRGSMSLR